MKFLRRGFVVGVFVVVLVLLYGFGGNITGDVTWTPATGSVGCEDSQIALLWDEIFKESSDGITVLRESVTECGDFYAYKNHLTGLLIGSFEKNNTLGLNTWRYEYPNAISKRGYFNSISFMYVNYTDLGKAPLLAATTFNEFSIAFNNLNADDIENASWSDVVSAETSYYNIFKNLGSEAFAASGGGYSYEEDVWSLSEDIRYVFGVYGEEDIRKFSYSYSNYSYAVLGFDENIPNYQVERNSSWTKLFEVEDYFDFSGNLADWDVEFKFFYIGANNTDGEWINYTIDSGDVKFKPKVGFLGLRVFAIRGYWMDGLSERMLNYSNIFNVTIVEDVNYAPVLLRNIEPIGVPRDGGVRIFLGIYFEDPDEDDMTYRVTGGDDLNITFNGSIMTLRLEENFTDWENIRVYASDGELEGRSNSIYVYEEGGNASQTLAEVVDNETDGVNESIGGGVASGVIANESGNAGDEESDGVNWMLWGFVGVIVLALVLFVIWFFVLRNATKMGPVAALPAGQSPVNAYLKKLNFPGS